MHRKSARRSSRQQTERDSGHPAVPMCPPRQAPKAIPCLGTAALSITRKSAAGFAVAGRHRPVPDGHSGQALGKPAIPPE